MRMLVVDAFTDRPFGGNPAGVCLLADAADPEWMQRVAAEMRHSETAFARPAGTASAVRVSARETVREGSGALRRLDG